MSKYARDAWMHGGWYSHGNITQEEMAKAKADVAGRMLCPYTNEWVAIEDAQLDHVLPLEWQEKIFPARVEPPLHRKFIAHADFNLLLVSGHANESKGARSISEWLPPYEAFHVPYAKI